MNYLLSQQTWIVLVATLILVSLCIGLHFEILSRCRRYLKQLSHSRRRRVLILIFVILTAHTAEIWLFAVGYYTLVALDAGSLVGLETQLLPDYVYYSAIVYTTVGFGDVFPTGAIRFLSGMEALTGLVMITWSASYTFLEMQRDWPQG